MAFRSRITRAAAYGSGAAVFGGGVLYYTYRPRNIPGLEPAAVPPPGELGELPPRFPKVKSRDEQIADLKRSGGQFTPTSTAVKNALLNPTEGEEVATVTPQDDDIYDLLIIGGGATGAGVALDAATRGLKVEIGRAHV